MQSDTREDEVLDGIEWAVDALREPTPVPPSWYSALHASLEQERRPRVLRRISMHPLAALAAGVCCITLGAIGARLTQDADTVPPVSVSADTGLPNASGIALRAAALEGTRGTVGVRFAIMAPGAQRVSLVGDFNGWDPMVTPLARSRDGSTWSTALPMPPGRHTYAFVIDGTVVADPNAPTSADDDFGVPNSVLLVVNTP